MTPVFLMLSLAAAPAAATGPRSADAAVQAWLSGDVATALSLLESSPASRERDLNRAVALLYSERYAESEALLEALVERDDRWLPALRWLARAQHEERRGEASATAARLRAARDAEAQDDLWAGHVFLEERDLEQARASYLSALRKSPDLSLAWLGLQQAEAALGRPDAACQAGQRAAGFTAADGVPPRLLLFPGEQLRYRVKWAFLRLAELRISTSEAQEPPGATRVVLTARSNPSIPFFHIDSSFESLIAGDGRTLSHANLASDSDNGRRGGRYEMEGDSRRCTARWVREGLFGFDLLPLPPHPHDGITVLLLMRALAQAGGDVTVPTAVDGTWRPTRLKTIGPETLRWRGRRLDVVHVQSVGGYRGPGGLSGVVDVWVSADERAIPYKARMKVAVGSVWLELLPSDQDDSVDGGES